MSNDPICEHGTSIFESCASCGRRDSLYGALGRVNRAFRQLGRAISDEFSQIADEVRRAARGNK